MNTSILHKTFLTVSTLLIATLTSGAADYHLSLDASVAALDTGYSTEAVFAPQLGLYVDVGSDKSQRLGIVYSRMSFNNRVEWVAEGPPFPDRIDAIIDNGRITVDQIKLAYRVNMATVSENLRIFITPMIGMGRVSESGIHTVVGGITGGFSQPFDESKWKCNASANIGLGWDLQDNWQFGLSCGYLYQDAHDAMLFNKLNGLQGTTSFTFSF